MLVTVVVPCYNEEATLSRSVAAVIDAFGEDEGLDLELLIVDDCSRDKSVEIAAALSDKEESVRLLRHKVNQGKGAALRTGITAARGDVIAIHDADLEYDPRDLIRVIDPIRRGVADVVYGSRFLNGGVCRVLYFWHSMGNRFLTLLSNMMTDLNLTDMETCYKAFKKEVLEGVTIEEDRFGFEPEITAKVAAQRVRVYEMAISYFGRTYEEGKKIGVRDGFRALYCILRYNANQAPWFLQASIYTLIGGAAALVNIAVFSLLVGLGYRLFRPRRSRSSWRPFRTIGSAYSSSSARTRNGARPRKWPCTARSCLPSGPLTSASPRPLLITAGCLQCPRSCSRRRSVLCSTSSVARFLSSRRKLAGLGTDRSNRMARTISQTQSMKQRLRASAPMALAETAAALDRLLGLSCSGRAIEYQAG